MVVDYTTNQTSSVINLASEKIEAICIPLKNPLHASLDRDTIDERECLNNGNPRFSSRKPLQSFTM